MYDILQNGMPISDEILNNDSFKNSIERGLDDIRQGNVISNEEANREIDEWLNK